MLATERAIVPASFHGRAIKSCWCVYVPRLKQIRRVSKQLMSYDGSMISDADKSKGVQKN